MRLKPKYFIPIVPTLLVNGTQGIGTGWSTKIPTYRLGELIDIIEMRVKRQRLRNSKELIPWVAGFKGAITKAQGRCYISEGIVKRANKTTLEITELPVGVWTKDYKLFLSKLCDLGFIDSYTEYHTTNDVHFVLHGSEKLIDSLFFHEDGVIHTLKLKSSMSTDNMHAFDKDGRITKFEQVEGN
jgi:DNA topoisomerase-2